MVLHGAECEHPFITDTMGAQEAVLLVCCLPAVHCSQVLTGEKLMRWMCRRTLLVRLLVLLLLKQLRLPLCRRHPQPGPSGDRQGNDRHHQLPQRRRGSSLGV